ncbi:MAG: hypothetical protein AB7F35_03940 [Acetobacteraceae bacterium]
MAFPPHLVALVLLAAVLATGVAMARRGPRGARTGATPQAVRLSQSQAPPPPATAAGGVFDLEHETRAVIDGRQGVGSRHFVQIRIAIQPDLGAAADPRAYRDVLADVLDSAFRKAPGGCVLVTGRRIGRWIEVAVSDDGPVLDNATHAVQLRHAQEHAALNGWLFSIQARPGYGTTVSLRLPAGTLPAVSPAGSTTASRNELVAAR